MTTAVTEERPPPTDSGTADELHHLYCHDENLALCGADLTNVEERDPHPNEQHCVVCIDLDPLPCPCESSDV